MTKPISILPQRHFIYCTLAICTISALALSILSSIAPEFLEPCGVGIGISISCVTLASIASIRRMIANATTILKKSTCVPQPEALTGVIEPTARVTKQILERQLLDLDPTSADYPNQFKSSLHEFNAYEGTGYSFWDHIVEKMCVAGDRNTFPRDVQSTRSVWPEWICKHEEQVKLHFNKVAMPRYHVSTIHFPQNLARLIELKLPDPRGPPPLSDEPPDEMFSKAFMILVDDIFNPSSSSGYDRLIAFLNCQQSTHNLWERMPKLLRKIPIDAEVFFKPLSSTAKPFPERSYGPPISLWELSTLQDIFVLEAPPYKISGWIFEAIPRKIKEAFLTLCREKPEEPYEKWFIEQCSIQPVLPAPSN